jgi:hypothetical protein
MLSDVQTVTRRKALNQALPSQNLPDASKAPKTTPPHDLTDISSETTVGPEVQTPPDTTSVITEKIRTNARSSPDPTSVEPEVQTPPDTTSVATEKIETNVRSSPIHPLFNKNDNTVQKGLPFFQARKANIVNFVQDSNTTWESTFGSSEVLSWKEGAKRKGAVNLFVIGRLDKANLMNAASEFDNPSYRLRLIIEPDTRTALTFILDNGPLKNTDNVRYPLFGRVASFSAKLRSIKLSDDLCIDVGDPFPFLYDGRDMAKDRETFLKHYPAADLSHGDMLAVQTNILSYDIPSREEFSRHTGYSLSLREVYFLGGNALTSSQTSPKNLKREGGSLVSPRKNKKAGDLAVFSDED